MRRGDARAQRARRKYAQRYARRCVFADSLAARHAASAADGWRAKMSASGRRYRRCFSSELTRYFRRGCPPAILPAARRFHFRHVSRHAQRAFLMLSSPAIYSNAASSLLADRHAVVIRPMLPIAERCRWLFCRGSAVMPRRSVAARSGDAAVRSARQRGVCASDARTRHGSGACAGSA